MATLQITALEGQHEGEMLEAEFDQGQIVLERAALWQRQAHKGPADLEFERAEPARMSLRLVFDGTRSSSSVQPELDRLHDFGRIDGILHRPPKVEVSWGEAAGVPPTFAAVIESVTVRYALFAENGVPLRAAAEVRLTQAAHVAVRAP